MGVSGSVIGLKLEKNIEFEKNRQNSDLTIYVFTGHGCIRIGYWNQLDKKKKCQNDEKQNCFQKHYPKF